VHPAPALPESGITLQGLGAHHPEASRLRAACDAIGLRGFTIKEGAPRLCAVFDTPRGRVRLDSEGV
jgi:hypothetical protein